MKMKNPNFGIWTDGDNYGGGIDIERPVMEGRTVKLTYKEKVKYLPTCDTVMGIEFKNIIYPKTKRDYEIVIYLAREAREREGVLNPFDYKIPNWFSLKGKEPYITLFRYLIAKGNRDFLYSNEGRLMLQKKRAEEERLKDLKNKKRKKESKPITNKE